MLFPPLLTIFCFPWCFLRNFDRNYLPEFHFALFSHCFPTKPCGTDMLRKIALWVCSVLTAGYVASWKLYYWPKCKLHFFTTFPLQRYWFLVCIVSFLIFVHVVSLITFFFRGSAIIIHTKKSIAFLVVLLQIQFKFIEAAKSSSMEGMQSVFNSAALNLVARFHYKAEKQ